MLPEKQLKNAKFKDKVSGNTEIDVSNLTSAALTSLSDFRGRKVSGSRTFTYTLNLHIHVE